jgi:hypothetical protein
MDKIKMKHLKLLESFIEDNQNIKIYHGSLSEEDAKSIIKNGWDESRRYRASAEGPGMGAFFSIDDTVYGEWIIEFNVPIRDFRNYIIFDTSPTPKRGVEELPHEVIDLDKKINGRVESVEDQILRINGEGSLVPRIERWYDKEIGKIKGWVTQWRFGMMSLHLRDPSIAKPIRYFKK